MRSVVSAKNKLNTEKPKRGARYENAPPLGLLTLLFIQNFFEVYAVEVTFVRLL